MIRVSGLSKTYGNRLALDRCSFEVPAGQIVGLVGKNGAGKTTALRILSNQLLPSAGDVWIDGRSLGAEGLAIRGRIGVLPETPPLYPEMTVTAYLRFAARLRRLDEARVEPRVQEVIERIGLDSVRQQRLGTLARGYRQRVGIAQAIVHDPPVVLLDEPMTGLDPIQIVQIRDQVLALKPRHTVLFSSHILSEVTQICDRVILLDQGRVVAEGTEAHLRKEVLQRRAVSVLVRGTREALAKALGGIAGCEVKPVAPLAGDEPGLARAELISAADVRAQAGKRCIEAGLELLELREERHGLEDLMLQLLERGRAA